MENYVADKLIKILEGIKECNHTMEMDDPSENPDFEKTGIDRQKVDRTT